MKFIKLNAVQIPCVRTNPLGRFLIILSGFGFGGLSVSACIVVAGLFYCFTFPSIITLAFFEEDGTTAVGFAIVEDTISIAEAGIGASILSTPLWWLIMDSSGS